MTVAPPNAFTSRPWRRVVFHHIPKTAGSFLLSHFRKEEVRRASLGKQRPIYPQFYLSANLPLYFAWYRRRWFFSSHFLFESYVPQRNEFKFTFLRHPVEMCYSYLRYAEKKDPVRLGWKIEGLDQRVKKLGPLKLLDHQLDNGLPLFPQGYFDFPLSTCHLVGFTDQMGRSLELLSEALGRTITDTKVVNGTEPRPAFDNYRRADIERCLKREIEIYESAAAGFKAA